mmetsp:Transcript_5767/g.6275  ORF Transcript_5767/g.6275 Transcript_5767/m.6275 type:complete len:390 (+) Transcript_5767:197-1366(+)
MMSLAVKNGVKEQQSIVLKYFRSIFLTYLIVILLQISSVQALSSRQTNSLLQGRNFIPTRMLKKSCVVTTTIQQQEQIDKSQSPFETAINHESNNNSNRIVLHGTELDDSESDVSTQSSKGTLIGIFLTYFGSTIFFAQKHLIGTYTTDLIMRDCSITLLCTALALVFVKSVTSLAANDILQPRDSRKIIHMLSAPLFMLLWPFFSDTWGSRIFAASVPFLQAIRLWLAATKRGGLDSDELASAISRSGDEKEALGGPFIYVIILFCTIIICFKDGLVGMMALSAMAAGDGMADIIGRRFGSSNKWFFSDSKSIAGTIAFITASSLCSIGLAYWFQFTGTVELAIPFKAVALKLVTISTLSAFVELIPVTDDNWSVPIAAAVLSFILLQ